MSKDLVFIASQSRDLGEAVAVIEIYNAQTETITTLISLGCAGETNFDVNPKTNEIVFNDCDGIKLLTVDSTTLEYNIELILDEADGFGIFWINSESIGFEDMSHSNPTRLVKMKAEKTPYYKSFRYQNLKEKPSYTLSLLRNEIFARHGHSFNSKEMKKYFGNKDWYDEKENHKVSAKELNSEEKELLKTIQDLEALMEGNRELE